MNLLAIGSVVTSRLGIAIIGALGIALMAGLWKMSRATVADLEQRTEILSLENQRLLAGIDALQADYAAVAQLSQRRSEERDLALDRLADVQANIRKSPDACTNTVAPAATAAGLQSILY